MHGSICALALASSAEAIDLCHATSLSIALLRLRERLTGV